MAKVMLCIFTIIRKKKCYLLAKLLKVTLKAENKGLENIHITQKY